MLASYSQDENSRNWSTKDQSFIPCLRPVTDTNLFACRIWTAISLLNQRRLEHYHNLDPWQRIDPIQFLGALQEQKHKNLWKFPLQIGKRSFKVFFSLNLSAYFGLKYSIRLLLAFWVPWKLKFTKKEKKNKFMALEKEGKTLHELYPKTNGWTLQKAPKKAVSWLVAVSLPPTLEGSPPVGKAMGVDLEGGAKLVEMWHLFWGCFWKLHGAVWFPTFICTEYWLYSYTVIH